MMRIACHITTCRFLVMTTGCWASGMPIAWAATGQGRETTVFVVGIGTVVAAIAIGFLLYKLSQRSDQDEYRRDHADDRPGGGRSGAVDSKLLMPAVMEQLNQLSGSPQTRRKVASAVNELVTKTLEGQVESIRHELDGRYGQIIEEQRRAKTVLERKYHDTMIEKKETFAVLESIAEGLVVINNKGEIVMMNPAAERLLDVKQDEQVGKSLVENLGEGQLVSLAKGQVGEDREIVLNAKDESTKRILRASNAMISDENGKTVGMVAVLSDVTKQRELEQLKTEFISKISHELRTPIVAMQHAISILVDQLAGPLSDDQQKFAGVVQRNLERLNILITDLLDLSKLESRKMEMRLELEPIAPVIQGVCDSLGAWARSKTITVGKRIPDGLPDATFDRVRISQVLMNLVANAVKFTPRQGRVTVEARLAAGGKEIEVSVTDTGVGINKEDIPKLFSKFQQVGERSPSDVVGTGLGLAIAKEIIEAHQGRIWAESKEAQGVRFAFTIPLSRSTQPPVS